MSEVRNNDDGNDGIGQEGQPQPIEGGTNITGNNPVFREEGVSAPSSNKRKKYSDVWFSFDLEITHGGKEEAVCKYCRKKFTGGSKSGTTHLKNHIKRCEKRNWEFQEGYKFDQTNSETKLAEMIVLHDYPFSIVEHTGFREFVSTLQPKFVMPPDKDSMKEIFQHFYHERRETLFQKFVNHNYRASVTLDIVESRGEDVSHLCLAAHFLDPTSIYTRQADSFFPERILLGFVKLPEFDNYDLLIRYIELQLRRLLDYDYKNIFSIVSVFPMTDGKLVNNLHNALATKKSIMFRGGAFHVQSCTQVISFIFEGCMKALREVTEKLRDGLKQMQDSQVFLRLFDHLLRRKNIFSALLSVQDFIVPYVSLNISFPFSDEWKHVTIIRHYIKVCYEIMKLSSGRLHPIASLYFSKLCDLYLLLKDYHSSANLLSVYMSNELVDKFKVYWDSNSLMLSMASVLDPTQKMEYIKFYFPQIYGEEESKMKIEDVRMNLRTLYEKYQHHVNESEPLIMSHVENINTMLAMQSTSYNSLSKRRKELKEFLSQRLSKSPKQISALDAYLEQDILPECSFEEVLRWWKEKSGNSRALFLMASDVLGIPVSTTLVKMTESVIKKHKMDRTFDVYDAEKFLCAQDWLREDQIGASKSPQRLSAVVAFKEEDSFTSDIENFIDDDDDDGDNDEDTD